MYLKKLKIWNFRKYGTTDDGEINPSNAGLEVYFNKKLNLLVGENDSGKTAVIDAIKHVLLTQSQEYLRLDEKDFFKGNGERTTSLKIECLFSGFDEKGKEASDFLEWIGFSGEENEYELKVWLTAEYKDNRVFTDIRAGADNEGFLLESKARELLKVTYLKPLRDALSELTPGYRSRLAQILKGHKLFINKQKDVLHPLEMILKRANGKIEDYFKNDELIIKNENDKEIKYKETAKEIKSDIDRYLNFFFPVGDNRESSIKIAGSELFDILNKLSLNIDENKSGLGSLNLLFIAAELLLLKSENKRGLQLALIEEIEAHLHTQSQLRLIEYLTKQDGQFILTTHSITLSSKIELENLIIFKENKVFPMGCNHTQLEKGDYKFLQRFLDATKANLFFARGVIIVEGDAENLLIPTIAEIIGKPLQQYGVSIVNVGSTAFKRYAKIFLRKNKDDEKFKGEWLNIPVAIITDKDKKSDDEINELEGEWNKQNSKIFIPQNITLEYEILKSGLKDDFMKATLIAVKIRNSKENYYNKLAEEGFSIIDKDFAKLTADDKDIDNFFEKYFKKKYASKAVTAEIFCEFINIDIEKYNRVFQSTDSDNSLRYLTDAINFVT